MNPFDVTGKIVLVTGGTRGLGRAISFHLASQGAIVFAGYFQNEEAAASFRSESDRKKLCLLHGQSKSDDKWGDSDTR